ncbi:MAG TPA: hypothetical protein VIF86_05795 [Methylobacter sp.]
MTIRVECYAGYQGEETPRRFFMGNRAIEIEQIIDRWLAPEHRYFKVRGGGDDIYILRHDELAEQWELTLFQSRKYAGSPLSST